jgi:lysophospholipase L1-like esterase
LSLLDVVMARFGAFLVFLFGLTLASLTSSLSILASKLSSYSALGDSYATGAGAGSPTLFPLVDIGCGRFSDAYPIQLANSTALNVAHSDFRNRACGGASTFSVLRDQVPWIRKDDIVSVTVGGNEVDFFLLLNECIYQWHPLSTCEAEWRRSRTLIESGEFVDNYEAMVKGTVKRLKPDGGGMLFVTGYARFFNEETVACDHASFSTRDPRNTLTRPMRRRFNDLIRSLNDVIRAATETHGATYVDIDSIFEGHRFCEDGVEEPDVTRSDTWFFNTKNVPGALLLGSDPEAHFTQQGLFDPIVDFMNFTRTFHPTSLGHKAIKNAILRNILDDSAVR